MTVRRGGLSRREAMGMIAAGGLSLSVAGCGTPRAPRDDEGPLPAEEALARLKEGNQRFVSGRMRHPHESAVWRDHLVSGQHPIAVIVACSDSRVPTELVFDQGFGDLFVIRNAGNVIATDVLGTIEYALVHLHVELVVVMGHESCGAVTAALEAKDRAQEPWELQEVLRMIDPALNDLPDPGDGGKRLAAAVEANVRYSVRRLNELAEKRNAAEQIRYSFVGAVYNLHTGAVDFLR